MVRIASGQWQNATIKVVWETVAWAFIKCILHKMLGYIKTGQMHMKNEERI
jgi:hypothetical protein